MMFKKFFNLFKKKDNINQLYDKLYLYHNPDILSLDENKLQFCNVVFQINDCKKQVIRQMPINGSLIFKFKINKAFYFHNDDETFNLIFVKEKNKNKLYGKFNNTNLSKDINLFCVKEFDNKNSLDIIINKNISFEIKHDLNSFKIWFDIEHKI